MPQPDSLAAALAQVQMKLPQIAKTQTATVRSEKGSYTYDYADLADVSEEILPLLGEVGLSWTCRPTLNADGKFVLAYKLLHISGESEEGEYPLPSSGTPQAIGGAISYARRYTLCAVTGVAPKGDDDDATAASTPAPKSSRPAQRRNAPRGEAEDRQQTAQRAPSPSGGPPLPGEDGGGVPPITAPQRAMVMSLFGKAGIDDRDERLDISRRLVGRPDLASANELTSREAKVLIDKLTEAEKHPQGFSGFLAHLLTATEAAS